MRIAMYCTTVCLAAVVLGAPGLSLKPSNAADLRIPVGPVDALAKAKALERDGKFDEAESGLMTALTILKALPRPTEQLAVALELQAEIHRELGRRFSAVLALRDAVGVRNRANPPNDFELAKTLLMYAGGLSNVDRE